MVDGREAGFAHVGWDEDFGAFLTRVWCGEYSDHAPGVDRAQSIFQGLRFIWASLGNPY